ncbi:hypothetical protein DFJ58DRAFT_739240 [Suillus subalutaceus]|uniref:uncharacterized protein n=1 Tax=Suillus subalutaceus TaxID=48586 RepID=UPI001B86A775|nr:uncharacterized protein DFJ58DRAFT_739240 [Suillus subalutaceus]KAG1820807.1 hypothetical protein DFJ58DRAFT_739240 [Suillus subalutaceus]
MAAVFGDLVGGPYYYTRNSRGKTPVSDMKSEPSSGMPVLSTTSWISSRSRRRGTKTETLRPADVTYKPSNTSTVAAETETPTIAAKPQTDTAVVQHDQVLGITNVITAEPAGCHEQLIDALQQVWVEPVCFVNVSPDDHARILEHMDSLTFSNYHTKMSYFPRRMILIVYSPHPVHEQPQADVFHHLTSSPQLGSTLENIFTIPDMQVTMMPTTTIAAETQLLWMVESGFTQSRPAIMAKVGDASIARRTTSYSYDLGQRKKKFATPMADSDAWKETREEGSHWGMSGLTSSLSNIMFGLNLEISIDVTTDPTAHGTLFPDINMGDVTDALNRGMDRVKATMSHTLDTIECISTSPSCQWPFIKPPTSATAIGTIANSLARSVVVDNPTIDASVDNPENAEPSISRISISNASDETTSSSELATSGTESSSEPSDDSDV